MSQGPQSPAATASAASPAPAGKVETLNIMCTICMEFYKPEHVVYATIACGHLFHRSCLFRWLEQSTLCPQCRKHCPKYRTHRVYLNFTEHTEEDDKLDREYQPAYEWVQLEAFDIKDEASMPEGAVKCGKDWDRNNTYVARVYHQSDLLPAMFVPSKGGVYAPYACRGHFLRDNIELLILSCDYKWVPGQHGAIPAGALVSGNSETYENLYTARLLYNGQTMLGKLHPSHGVAYFAFKERELNVKEYEVLVPITTTTTTQ